MISYLLLLQVMGLVISWKYILASCTIGEPSGHLYLKTGYLFVLFCLFVCYVEIFWTVGPLVTFLVLSESSWQGGVYGLCVVAF